jgi:hypothetical protein
MPALLVTSITVRCIASVLAYAVACTMTCVVTITAAQQTPANLHRGQQLQFLHAIITGQFFSSINHGNQASCGVASGVVRSCPDQQLLLWQKHYGDCLQSIMTVSKQYAFLLEQIQQLSIMQWMITSIDVLQICNERTNRIEILNCSQSQLMLRCRHMCMITHL